MPAIDGVAAYIKISSKISLVIIISGWLEYNASHSSDKRFEVDEYVINPFNAVLAIVIFRQLQYRAADLLSAVLQMEF